MSWWARKAMAQLASRGFVVQRHPAVRRQKMLETHGVDLVFDVGAAKGGYAQELREFKYSGRIVSFEPIAAAYAELQAASSGDDRWTCVHSALGSSAGRQTINIASNSDSSSLLPMADEHRSAAPHVDFVGSEEITVSRLDDVATEHLTDGARPFLKVDTQGFEREVLAGGAQTLERCVGLQLELSFVPLYSGGMLVDEAMAFAYDHGFRMVALAQGFTHPTGAVLQADGVFFRPRSGA
jgi:FkbM family methyltransferase